MPNWEGSTRKLRLPRDWHRRRASVLRRDKRICHVCKEPGADQVDHVRPGDNHDEANLAAIHKGCHATKSSGEGGAASAAARARRAALRWRPAEPHPGLIQPGEEQR